MNKIYILPVNPVFQPKRACITYPCHDNGYTIEEDFLAYLDQHPELLTDNFEDGDWYYLPIFWTNWLVNHKFGEVDLCKLQDEVNRCIIDDSKTFTICRYSDGPKVQIGKMIQFLCSRKTRVGIDIPHVCAPHKLPSILPEKKYLASFAGNIGTHKIRIRMAENFKNSQDILFVSRSGDEHYFVQTILESYVALSPRGYGGSSFRFYEAMQLGIVPFLIGDIDHRPFKKFIDWNKISFYASDEVGLEEILRKIDKQQAIEMGITAQKVWKEELNYQKWCKYVLKELKIC